MYHNLLKPIRTCKCSRFSTSNILIHNLEQVVGIKSSALIWLNVLFIYYKIIGKNKSHLK